MVARRGGLTQIATVWRQDGTEYSVPYGLIEIVAWESNNSGRPYADGGGNVPFSRQAWVIWSASKKAGHTDADFKAWLGTVADIRVGELGEEPDPTSGLPEGD